MYEASPNQIRPWRHYRRFPESPALNMTVALLFEDLVERIALQRAAAVALSRHEVLTARPIEVLGRLYWRPVQTEAGGADTVLHVECADADEALAALRDEAGRPFALKSELPIRLKLITVKHHTVLVINVHHIACDDWSMDLLINEIATLYAAYRTGMPANLPAAPSYENISQCQKNYLHSAAGATDVQYWIKTLQGAAMGVGFAPDVTPDVASPWPRGRTVWAFMSAHFSECIRSAANSADVTPFVLLMAGFARLLARSTGESDPVIGVPYANRQRADDASLVGFVVNTLPLRFSDTGLDSADFIRSVAATMDGGFAHQHLPYYQILSKLGPEFESGAKSVFRTMFALQSSRSAHYQFQDMDATQCRVSTGAAKCDQTWTIEERNGVYTVNVEWNPDLYTETCIRTSMEQYRALLHALVMDLVSTTDVSRPRSADNNAGDGLQWPMFDGLRDVFAGPVISEHCGLLMPATM